MENPRPVRFQIADAARKGLMAPKGFEKQPGYCARWVRQVLATVPRIYHPQPGPPDARAQAQTLVGKVRQIPPGMEAEGDVLYWLSPEHGPHGHVGIYVGGGMVAENSSAQPHADGDARGYRALKKIGKPSKVFRFE